MFMVRDELANVFVMLSEGWRISTGDVSKRSILASGSINYDGVGVK